MEVEDILEHRLVDDFNEAKVKRDNNGKFANKAGNNASKDDKINKALDKKWATPDAMLASFGQVAQDNSDEIESAVRDMALQKGITDPEKVWKDPDLTKQAVQIAVDVVNSKLPTSIQGVSPSGTQAIEAYVKTGADVNKGLSAIGVRAVPYSGVNPHPATTEQLRSNYVLDSQDAEKSGFHFNPNAQLDPSRVHNIDSSGSETPLTSTSSILKRRLFHEDPNKNFALALIEAKPEDAQQHGVIGMRWGYRKSDPNGKTNGRRVINAVLGDKRYWRNAAIITGLSLTGLAAAAAAPAVLPASAVAAAGGASLLSFKIAFATSLTARGAGLVSAIQNTKRAITNKAAHAELGGDPTIQDIYNSLSPEQTAAAEELVSAYFQGLNVTNNSDLEAVWNTMTDDQKVAVAFIAQLSTSIPEESMAHSDEDDVVSDILKSVVEADPEDAKQHGILGQRWGFRRSDAQLRALRPRTSSEDKIATDRIASKIKKGGLGAVSNQDLKTFTARLQAENDYRKITASPAAQQTIKKGDGFIKRFVKSQTARQFDRVSSKAIDIAVEEALKASGFKVSETNPKLGAHFQELSSRIAPKHKKGK